MNTYEIESIINCDKFSQNKWLGVFAFDKLPKIDIYPSCLILNTDKSKDPGSHWLAIYFSKSRTAEFFDSFGQQPDYFELDEYLRENSNKIIYNDVTIQGLGSNYCGLYSILFLYLRNRGHNFSKIINFFKSKNINDHQIADFLTNKNI